MRFENVKDFVQKHRALLVALVFALLVALAPALEAWMFIGEDWRGIPQAYGDEFLYYAQAHAVAEGHWGFGNPYLLEHAGDMPLVIFGGTWLSSLPLLFHIPLMTSATLDYILWGIIFVVLFYWLLRELRAPKWLSAAGALFAFIQTCGLIFRMSSRQTVYPFFLLFYIVLARFLKNPNKANTFFLGLAAGATFWVFSYLWQTVVITLGLLALYALLRRQWPLLRATLIASSIGGGIGLPTLLYTLWISHTNPAFWESIARFGLVATHLPEAEVIYSGGWIGAALALLGILYWRIEALRRDVYFRSIGFFIVLGGLGLWIMQGSNLITGQLLETSVHMRPFIGTWLVWAGIGAALPVWRHRAEITKGMRLLCIAGFAVLMFGASNFMYTHLKGFLFDIAPAFWKTQQLYAAPYAWLNAHESQPVVVWGSPNDFSTEELPIFTRHFVLYAGPTIFHLVSNAEIRERYLVASYFNNPTVQDLKDDIGTYLGRQDVYHHAKTIERGIKICRIVYFWDKNKDCGIPPTSAELMGEKFFNDLERQFQTDIKPNIQAYLQKYHVSYILKDIVLDPQYHPEKLGAVRVYSDGRFELYRLKD